MRRRCLAAGLGEHAIEHLHDDLLLGLGQLVESLDLLLQQRRAAALAGAALQAEQLVGIDAVEPGERRHDGHWHTGGADLVVGEGLLGDAELIGDGLLA